MKPRFTLYLGHWYAAEIIGDEFSPPIVRDYSPVRVDSIAPTHRGQRRFALSFYHANYPEGVRDKVYSLQTLERGEHFLLARSTTHHPVRLLLFYEISWAWLKRHFGMEPRAGEEQDLDRWLSSHL